MRRHRTGTLGPTDALPRAWRAVWAAGSLLFAFLRGAAAEEGPGPWYVLGGPVIVHSQGVTDGEGVLVRSTPGGKSFVWQFAAGRFVTSRLSVEVDYCRTGSSSAREPARYGDTYYEERRDQFFGVTIRLHLRAGPNLDLEPTVGLGIVRQAGASAFEHASSWSNTGEHWRIGWTPHDPWFDPYASVGLGLRLGGRRFALAPSVRLRGTLRGSRYEGWWGEATARFTTAVGLFGQVRF
jgi:hypothetical protein